MLRRIILNGTIRRSNLLQRFSFSDQDSGNKQPPQDNNNSHIPIIDYDDPDYLPLPVYPAKINEPLHQKKARLIYQSRKRGMLENDLLLSTFAAKYLESMNEEQTHLYDQLINGPTNDWDIYYWATGNKPTPKEYDTPIMNMLKAHTKNVNKEQRLRQPNL